MSGRRISLDRHYVFPVVEDDPYGQLMMQPKMPMPKEDFAGAFESRTILRGRSPERNPFGSEYDETGAPEEKRITETYEYWSPTYGLAHNNRIGRGPNTRGNRHEEVQSRKKGGPRKLPATPQHLPQSQPALSSYRQGPSTRERNLYSDPDVYSRLPPPGAPGSCSSSSTPQTERASSRKAPSGFNPPPTNLSPLALQLQQTRFQNQTRAANYPIMPDSGEGSVREGSTVDRIYKEYEGNRAEENSHNEFGRDISQQRAPNPEGHKGNQQHLSQSDPSLDNASAWENMSNENTSDGEPVSSLDNSKDVSTLPSLPVFENNNSLLHQQRASDSSVQPNSDGRLPEGSSLSNFRTPLELQVTQALRHYSGLSMGSFRGAENRESRRETEYHAMIDSKKSALPTPEAAPNTTLTDKLQTPYAEYVYDSKAAHNVPNDKQGLLTVPGSQMLPSPLSSSAVSESIIIPASDYTEGDDWETVNSSYKNLKKLAASSNPFQVKRCGDSIADVSDEGNPNLDLETPNGFLSTERVAMHPGNETYQGKLRRLFMPKSNTPVLLPSYNEHKVNGYSADSTRIRPRPNHFHSSPPLKQYHRHPFNSSPPEDLSPVGKKSRSTNLFPRRSKIPPATYLGDQDTSIQEFDPTTNFSTRATMASSPKPAARKIGVAAYDVDGGPMIDHNHIRASSPAQESSFQSESQVFHTDGLTEPMIQDNMEVASFLQRPAAAYMKSKSKASESRPFFHQSNEKRARSAVKALAGGQERRPKIFLNDESSTMSVTESGRDPNEAIPMNDFVYNDPRSPVRSQKWQQLYPQDELVRIQNGESASGRPVSRSHQVYHLNQPPQLLRRSDFPRYTGNLARQQKRWSNTLLWICILFVPLAPFLLPAYATGYLDWLIRKRSEGLIDCFTKQRKRHALFAALAYWALIIVAVTIGVIFGIEHY